MGSPTIRKLPILTLGGVAKQYISTRITLFTKIGLNCDYSEQINFNNSKLNHLNVSHGSRINTTGQCYSQIILNLHLNLLHIDLIKQPIPNTNIKCHKEQFPYPPP